MNLVKYGRKIFNPTKLVEHIPGQKRGYLNRLTGTKTEFTFGDEITMKDYIKSTNDYYSSSGFKEVESLYLHPIDRVPKNMLVPNYEQGRRAVNGDEIPLDTPVTITTFERVKSYLFGLIKGEPTRIVTVNIADKFKAHGEIIHEYIMGVSGALKGAKSGLTHGAEVHVVLPSRADGVREETFIQAVRRTLADKRDRYFQRLFFGTEL